MVAGALGSRVGSPDARPIRFPSTRARRLPSLISRTLGAGVCQGDSSESVRTDVSRFPSASGSIIVTDMTGGPPPIVSTSVVAVGCLVTGAELLLGTGTVLIPGIWLLLALLAVFSTSWPGSDERKDTALSVRSSAEAV